MATFRIAGHVNIPFIHEISGNSLTAEKAEERVADMRLKALDNWSEGDGENTIYSVIELDEDGNEIEKEED